MYQTMLLSQSEIAELLTMDEVIQTVEEVFTAHGNNQVIMPAKITLDLSKMGKTAWTNAMPAYIAPLGASGIKWAGGYIDNRKKNMPYVVATIILQDPDTGIQLAVMDGAHITNLRTGAAAAVVAKRFCRKGASRVAIIGAGVQGRTSVWALTRLMKVGDVRAYDKYPEASAKYASEISAQFGLKVTAVGTAEEAVVDADIVITATQANEPIVKREWLKKGSVSVSLGSYQEFDDDCSLKVDRVFVDSWDQCSHRGELAHLVEQGRFSKDLLTGEIGDVFAGKIKGRTSDDETIMTVPIGLGSLDLAIAKRVYEKALKTGTRRYFEFT